MRQPRTAAAEPLELDPSLDPFAHESVKRLVTRYGSPLFIIDAERLRRQYSRLVAALPGVDLHYAVKALPHPSVIETLAGEGAYFDLATNGEVELVRRSKVAPERCVHTHPIKRECDIRTALAYGVKRFVVDNPDELRKFVKYRNRCAVLIRIAFASPEARCDLSRSVGCAPQAAPDLLRLAADLEIEIDGFSFHAGSPAARPGMFVEAISQCAALMAVAARMGHPAGILDIGGGFPVEYPQNSVPIEEFCRPIRAALKEIPAPIRLVAQPGRYIAAPSAISVTSVMGRAQRGTRWWYYLDDGLYGSYSGLVFDHAQYPVEALVPGGDTYPSVLAGPTCDNIDVIDESLQLPKLDVGDLIVGRMMGAYTRAAASDFDFFPRATVLSLDNGRLLSDRARR